jgi:hypothetical protein
MAMPVAVRDMMIFTGSSDAYWIAASYSGVALDGGSHRREIPIGGWVVTGPGVAGK